MARAILFVYFVFAAQSVTGEADASCTAFGCGTYKKTNPCQCNTRCSEYHDCCDDYTKTCGTPGPSPGPSPSPHPHPPPTPGTSCKFNGGPTGGPEQQHLALGSTQDSMSITFATSKSWTQVPQCSVTGLGTFTGRTRTYTSGNWNGLLHTVVLHGLQEDTTYSYDCGSGPVTFKSPPRLGKLPVTVAAVADLGEDCDRSGCGNATIARLGAAAEAGEFSMLLHVGDIAYTGGDTCIWDNFFREMENATARVPYMVAAGNHEHYYNFSGYRTRFTMPGLAAATGNLWYSFDYGGVHFAVFSTEHDLEPQAIWLRQDLQKAAANRGLVPWIVVMAHKPMYCSTNDYYDCNIGRHKIAASMEAILHEASVDLFLAGHLHNYERSWPVFNGTLTAKGYANPKAPVHVVVGMAGDIEGLTDKWLQAPTWRAVKSAQLGYASLTFQDPETMHFSYVLSDSGEIADRFTIAKGSTATIV